MQQFWTPKTTEVWFKSKLHVFFEHANVVGRDDANFLRYHFTGTGRMLDGDFISIYHPAKNINGGWVIDGRVCIGYFDNTYHLEARYPGKLPVMMANLIVADLDKEIESLSSMASNNDPQSAHTLSLIWKIRLGLEDVS